MKERTWIFSQVSLKINVQIKSITLQNKKGQTLIILLDQFSIYK